MMIATPFEFALVVRGRRRDLKLRQVELAKAAGVSREWIIALEHGKPGLEFAKVLNTLRVLNIQLSIYWCTDAPSWTVPFTEAAIDRPAPPRQPAPAPPATRAPPRSEAAGGVGQGRRVV